MDRTTSERGSRSTTAATVDLRGLDVEGVRVRQVSAAAPGRRRHSDHGRLESHEAAAAAATISHGQVGVLSGVGSAERTRPCRPGSAAAAARDQLHSVTVAGLRSAWVQVEVDKVQPELADVRVGGREGEEAVLREEAGLGEVRALEENHLLGRGEGAVDAAVLDLHVGQKQ